MAAASRKKAQSEDTKTLDEFMRCLERAEKPHAQRCERYHKMDKVYDAVLEPKDDSWESNLHPPYALQLVELIESNLVDEHPKTKVSPLRPEDEQAASAMEQLLSKQASMDNYAEKLGPFIKQSLIRGISVAKVFWRYEAREVTRRVWEPKMDELGQTSRVEGDPKTETRYKSWASFQPWNATDFMWDPGATCIDDATYVLARSYSTLAELRVMEKLGVYKNVDDLEGVDQPTGKPGLNERDLRGRVEVIEKWTRDRIVVVANRAVVLRDEDNPFHHGQLPFVVCTTLPQPFKFEGKSEVELIADLQAELWQLQNQRLDNVRLINNYVEVVREGSLVEDDGTPKFPGKRYLVSGNASSDISFPAPPVSILQPAIEAEERIKLDLEAITGAVSALSGANPAAMNMETATQYQGVMTMAAKRIIRKKQAVLYALRRAGLQRIALNQQLLSLPERVKLAAEAGGRWDWVTPEGIQGELDFEVEDVAESLLQEQRRAQALSLAQFYLGNLMAFVDPMTGQPFVDTRKLAEYVDKSFDQTPGKFLKSPDQMPPPQPMMGMGAPPPMANATPGMGGGATPSQMVGQGAAA